MATVVGQGVLGVPIGDVMRLLEHIAMHQASTRESMEKFGWSRAKHKRVMSSLRHFGCQIDCVRVGGNTHFEVRDFGIFRKKILKDLWVTRASPLMLDKKPNRGEK